MGKLIVEISDDLHKKLKIAAIESNQTVKDFTVHHLERILK